MTTQEFSNTFDTLLNSYANKAVFGDQASHQEIVLDEYEKSVLLTQAQDIIIKQYFQQSNINEGFDGSIRRQMDFSSLISVAQVNPIEEAAEPNVKFADNSWLFSLPTTQVSLPSNTAISKILFILNEKLILTKTENDIIKKREFVVVPINYLEYDRQMSKPFAQPLKKQCWRLLQDNNAATVDGTLYAEIIPTDAAKALTDEANQYTPSYKIRYVRRPRPILLVDLTNAGLSIDGVTTVTECELNPILHMDILNKAVELAYTTRASGNQRSDREQQ